VLDQQRRQAHAQLAQLGHGLLDLAGDQVKAPRTGAQPDLSLNPHFP
jgi:hypothetical protein